MTRGAKGCLLVTGFMLGLLALVAVALLFTRAVPSDTILEVTVAGEIVEDAEDTIFTRLMGPQPVLLRDITTAIHRAKTDDQINGLMAIIKPFSMGLGKVQEIRDAVLDFRSSGKWAHVYLESAGEFSAGNAVYYLASAFDEITLAPQGDINLNGILGVAMLMRGSLDKLGIYPDLDSIGKYKSAKDVYTEKEMTEAHREATMMFLRDWYDQIVQGIAEGRGMETSRIEELIDQGPFTGDEAFGHGLVDRLAYYDEFEKAIADLNDGDLSVLEHDEYVKKRGGPSGRNRIAVITGMGLILRGRSSIDPWGGAIMGSDTIMEAFQTARRDRRVKAIVFRVDSPGGSPLASDLIWRETQLAREEKPVIVSMSDTAASGGYYVAAGATKIVSQPATLTGSIGVVAGKMVTSGLYEWLGLTREALQIGQNATYYYTGQRYSKAEKEIYWKFLNRVYDQFTGRVAEGRGMTREEVDRIGQGHVWSGARGKQLGLVDELGGLITAISIAKKEAGIPEEEDVRLVYLPKKRTLLQELLWDEGAGSRARLPGPVGVALKEFSRMALLEREAVWLLAGLPETAP